MLDLVTCKIKPYTFKDGDKIIVTRNPSQGLYTKMLNLDLDNTVECMTIIDEVMKGMLSSSYHNYITDLPFDVKITLVKDYLQYHMEQLEGKFPSSGISR